MMLPPQFYMYYVTILVCGVVMGSGETSWMLLGGTSAAQPPNDDTEYGRWGHTKNTETQRATKRKIESWCMSLPGLVTRQQRMCISNPALVAAAAQGTEMAVKECERQFVHMRWNCSLIFNQYTKTRRRAVDGTIVERKNGRMEVGREGVLAPGLANATKEAAFLHAIMSAGIAYSVTLACRSGELYNCHCDKSVTKLDIDIEILAEKIVAEESNDASFPKFKHNTSFHKRHAKRSTLSRLGTNVTWDSYPSNRKNNFEESDANFLSWGGCSDDVRYGVRYSRRFVEAPYKGIPRRKLSTADAINLHNSEVGRRIVQSLRRMHCRCHGTSGSCNVQTCWMQMASFQEVGDRLREKYMSAIQADVNGTGKRKRKTRLRYMTDSGRLRSVPKTELAFVNPTPSLCTRDDNLGILGTAGRKCLKHSGDSGDCRYLCCGRGFNVKEIRSVKRCECKFVWCCRVHCKECEVFTEEYTCKA